MAAFLVLLSAVPVLAGAARLTQLTEGAPITAENARFFAMPAPVVVHIITASVFCLVGAFQFSAGVRRRWPVWHRRAGRVIVVCGVLAASSGLWMTAFYPHPPGDSPLLTVFRFIFGSAMLASLLSGFAAIRRRDVSRHRAWMARGYAIGQGAGTQVLVFLPWTIALGQPSGLVRALLMGSAWVINLAVAEWLLRRGDRRHNGRPVVAAEPALAVSR
jgi:uncharacterized membrane protein